MIAGGNHTLIPSRIARKIALPPQKSLHPIAFWRLLC
jgi:hypothetical protein